VGAGVVCVFSTNQSLHAVSSANQEQLQLGALALSRAWQELHDIPRLRWLHRFASSSYWLIMMFTFFLIG